MTTDLATAVHELTNDRLAHLRAAITSSASIGGGRSLPNERIPLDPRALETDRDIATTIAREYRHLGGTAEHATTEATLNAWHAIAKDLDLDYTDDWTRRLTAWAADIDRILDPPRTVELLDTPCITCGKAETLTPEGTLQSAVIIEYRRDPTEQVRDVRTICRACRAVWEGKHGVESFSRYADEQAAHTQPYEVDVPASRGLRHDAARDIARASFEDIAPIHGRIRTTRTPTREHHAWTFTAHLATGAVSTDVVA
ncbi:hypothetical protein OVA14_07140 [Agrococcus sp. SL85]|uniref:hypothetical protein n=1 Tax=Agrococcus sp. SL85 TaxID=2995141 RepID=UPI00226D2327|nr:hypothetical protein [Agrococcus sp. SL85]WAC65167.1 hypothetical protein OVA14_07140 [Agrococcus sp. SL85]